MHAGKQPDENRCTDDGRENSKRDLDRRGGYLLFIDTLARTAAPVEIPLGILTAVIGTPFFIWLLAGMQRTWS